jgi:hypothetical protein
MFCEEQIGVKNICNSRHFELYMVKILGCHISKAGHNRRQSDQSTMNLLTDIADRQVLEAEATVYHFKMNFSNDK